MPRDPFSLMGSQIVEHSLGGFNGDELLGSKIATVFRIATPILAGITAGLISKRTSVGLAVGVGTLGLVLTTKRLADSE